MHAGAGGFQVQAGVGGEGADAEHRRHDDPVMEGLQRIVEACGGAQQAFQLMMLEHLDTLAETSAKAISNIKFDKVVVWENGGSNGRSNTADFLHKMAGTLPPMLHVMRDIGGIDVPDSLAQITGAERVKTNGDAHVAERGEAKDDKDAPVATTQKPRVQ